MRYLCGRAMRKLLKFKPRAMTQISVYETEIAKYQQTDLVEASSAKYFDHKSMQFDIINLNEQTNSTLVKNAGSPDAKFKLAQAFLSAPDTPQVRL